MIRRQVLIKKYRFSDSEDVYSALGVLLNDDCSDIMEWASNNLAYNPIDIQEAKELYSLQTILYVYFKFKTDEDAVQFLLSNNIEV